MIPTPDLSHLTSKDYDLVYEPAGKQQHRQGKEPILIQRQRTPFSSLMPLSWMLKIWKARNLRFVWKSGELLVSDTFPARKQYIINCQVRKWMRIFVHCPNFGTLHPYDSFTSPSRNIFTTWTQFIFVLTSTPTPVVAPSGQEAKIMCDWLFYTTNRNNTRDLPWLVHTGFFGVCQCISCITFCVSSPTPGRHRPFQSPIRTDCKRGSTNGPAGQGYFGCLGGWAWWNGCDECFSGRCQSRYQLIMGVWILYTYLLAGFIIWERTLLPRRPEAKQHIKDSTTYVRRAWPQESGMWSVRSISGAKTPYSRSYYNDKQA